MESIRKFATWTEKLYRYNNSRGGIGNKTSLSADLYQVPLYTLSSAQEAERSKKPSIWRKIILKGLKALIDFAFKVGAFGGEGGIKHAMDYSCESAEKYGNDYLAYYRWPQKTNRIFQTEYSNHTDESIKTAILITGLLKLDNDFTVETVKLYRTLYPTAFVIISTWDTQDKEVLGRLSAMEHVYVVCSTEPKNVGVGHINCQLKTALEGIRLAQKLGAGYILRTRADVRIYRKGILAFCEKMLNMYPTVRKGQTKRILTMSGRCGTSHLYYVLCDFLTYGYVDDMEKLYSIAPYAKEFSEDDEKLSYLEKTRRCMTPESFLYKSYLDQYIQDCKYGMAIGDYYQAVKDCFVVLDEDFFQAYWYKYESRFDWTRGRSYERPDGENIDFLFWMLMQEDN